MTEEEKIFAGKMFDPRKQELKDLREQNAKEAIACPHGHGLCHPFPLGRKPCECGACQIEQPKNDPARSRADG